jgi:hypothetical protein
VKVHNSHHRNKLVDQLSKEAASKNALNITYNKLPKSAVISELKELGLIKRRSEWDSSNKGALTKPFFSKSKRQTSQKTANVPTFIKNSNRSREIEGISTQIQEN